MELENCGTESAVFLYCRFYLFLNYHLKGRYAKCISLSLSLSLSLVSADSALSLSLLFRPIRPSVSKSKTESSHNRNIV